MTLGIIITIIVLVLVVALIARLCCIVPEAEEWIIEFLGSYQETWEAGLHIKVPFFQKIRKKVSLREQVIDFEPQSVISKDNCAIQVDSVVYFKIINSKDYTYKVERPIAALENLTMASIRNKIGSMTLDETLTARDEINAVVTHEVDMKTDPWGIKIENAEVKRLIPPGNIQEAMDKQIEADRNKRAMILSSEAQKESAINIAQGEKEAAILAAQADAEQLRIRSEADAKALLIRQDAKAKAIKMINDSAPSAQYIKLEEYAAMTKIADGNSTKIIMPSDMTNLAAPITGLLEAVKTPTPARKQPMTQQVQTAAQTRPTMPRTQD